MSKKPAFTLVELLVVIAIIALLASILMPSLFRARDLARSALCANHLRNVGLGWNYYNHDNDDRMLPGRFGSSPLGPDHDKYWVGNGWKYRPRWVAYMGSLVGDLPFDEPSEVKAGGGDRQDYTGKVYLCPAAEEWSDERNYAYGYNHQFLGNARNSPSGSGYRNFPVSLDSIEGTSETVMAADSMGTAAAFPESQRTPYDNNGSDVHSMGNHGWALDPPRLTPASDRGPGDGPGDPRIGVDPRHMDKVTAVFCDIHVSSMTPEALGYDVSADGTQTANGNNRLFSGKSFDADPPPVW